VKVVISACYGGFSVSTAATVRLRELGNATAIAETLKGDRYPEGEICDFDYDAHCRDISRDDPQLIQVIGELGDKANGSNAKLKIVEVPDGTDWEICEYDGFEHVAEKHRSWS
jgi:hypothetical protein